MPPYSFINGLTGIRKSLYPKKPPHDATKMSNRPLTDSPYDERFVDTETPYSPQFTYQPGYTGPQNPDLVRGGHMPGMMQQNPNLYPYGDASQYQEQGADGPGYASERRFNHEGGGHRGRGGTGMPEAYPTNSGVNYQDSMNHLPSHHGQSPYLDTTPMPQQQQHMTPIPSVENKPYTNGGGYDKGKDKNYPGSGWSFGSMNLREANESEYAPSDASGGGDDDDKEEDDEDDVPLMQRMHRCSMENDAGTSQHGGSQNTTDSVLGQLSPMSVHDQATASSLTLENHADPAETMMFNAGQEDQVEIDQGEKIDTLNKVQHPVNDILEDEIMEVQVINDAKKQVAKTDNKKEKAMAIEQSNKAEEVIALIPPTPIISWKLPEYEATYHIPPSTYPTAKISLPGLIREEILLSPDHAIPEFTLMKDLLLSSHRTTYPPTSPDPDPRVSLFNFHTVAVLAIEAFHMYASDANMTLGTEMGMEGIAGSNITAQQIAHTDADEIFFAIIDNYRIGKARGKRSYDTIRGIQELCDLALEIVFYIKEHPEVLVLKGEKKGLKHDGVRVRRERSDKGVKRGRKDGDDGTEELGGKGQGQKKGGEVVGGKGNAKRRLMDKGKLGAGAENKGIRGRPPKTTSASGGRSGPAAKVNELVGKKKIKGKETVVSGRVDKKRK